MKTKELVQEVSKLSKKYEDISGYSGTEIPGARSLKGLLKKGLGVARITANRIPLKTNVLNLRKTGETYGIQNSILVVPGKIAKDSGFELIDFWDGKEVSGRLLGNYVAVIDGQTRLAAMNSRFDLKMEFPVIQGSEFELKKLLRVMNCNVHPWKNTDRIIPLSESGSGKNYLIYKEIVNLIDDKWPYGSAVIMTTLSHPKSKALLDKIYMGTFEETFPGAPYAKILRTELLKVFEVSTLKKARIAKSILKAWIYLRDIEDSGNLEFAFTIMMAWIRSIEKNYDLILSIESEDTSFYKCIEEYYNTEVLKITENDKDKREVYIDTYFTNPEIIDLMKKTKTKLGQ